jgi:TatD DNase family protein
MLFDTHCHLDVAAFDDDREAVLNRARAAGVSLILNPAYDMESSRRAVALAESEAGVVAAVGVHPNDAAEFSESVLDELRELVRMHRMWTRQDASRHRRIVVAIGEIGLDYHWKTVAPERQAEAFISQLRLARDLELAVIIHCREAYDDCLDVLCEHGGGLSLVLHAFGGNSAHMKAALDLGYYIGVGGPVTYPGAHALRDLVRAVPMERMVIETDAPYLAPQPSRGRRNEPAFVRMVAEKVADVRNMSVDDVVRITAHNGRRLFRLGGWDGDRDGMK